MEIEYNLEAMDNACACVTQLKELADDLTSSISALTKLQVPVPNLNATNASKAEEIMQKLSNDNLKITLASGSIGATCRNLRLLMKDAMNVGSDLSTLKEGDKVDLSSIEKGYASSYGGAAVSLMTKAGKNATFDKTRYDEKTGVTWYHFKKADGEGYAWFKEEDLKTLMTSQNSDHPTVTTKDGNKTTLEFGASANEMREAFLKDIKNIGEKVGNTDKSKQDANIPINQVMEKSPIKEKFEQSSFEKPSDIIKEENINAFVENASNSSNQSKNQITEDGVKIIQGDKPKAPINFEQTISSKQSFEKPSDIIKEENINALFGNSATNISESERQHSGGGGTV